MDLYDELPNSELLYLPEFTLILEASAQNNVTVMEFLMLNPNDLSRVLKRSINEVVKFKQILIRELEQQNEEKDKPVLLTELSKPVSFTTGDVEIDNLLGGGIYTHGITEIFGESSTGKSQFLMLLSLSVQLPLSLGGLNGKSVYITTEGDLPTERLKEIITSRPEFSNNNVSQSNIFTVGCNDLMTQEHIIKVQLPVLLEQNKDINLLIIDSISHHMRVELQSSSFKESHANRHYINELAEHLLFLAKKYSVAIVVANQVSDKILLTSTDSFSHEISDYDYQMGWIVGWKDSSIVYRQKLSESNVNNKNNLEDSAILSDDDDYMLVEREINKAMEINGIRVKQEFINNDKKSSKASNNNKEGLQNVEEGISKSFNAPKNNKIVKRKVDTHTPNLGLSWANHVSTRILLKKSYKASLLVTRGEAHLYKGNDPSAFWQVKRIMKIVFSTYTTNKELAYTISEKGIEYM
ncbi:hypothetical protein TPHA_0A04450 [Tetrapisispora phaffii CBS 4417]|uniref:RecA family profile 1 domain-containing protein n=1 Tax=Tetrapisispora phaffii (strain ATCC 24235 / CBS 4417 / NBRC 1672 / NRRL Y-8282 / UCD 70-5) TaxID=1071381 RepID=G8BNP0_TETPH|nr:hypothetical protein TPHA_0A04450 [Tetrapisispora phaffii CBS 4417]CCE61518.1 hypothetical protein TPHA_0A04450 [Tetrapisispora phaffii CBS 4417]